MQNVIQKSKFKIGIIGAGTMGQIFIDRLLANKIFRPSQILVNSRSPIRLKAVRSVDKATLINQCQVIILAVKPQDFEKLTQEFKEAEINKSQLIISIMAGVDIKTIQKLLGVRAVVRAMPNLPAKIGQGITVWKASAQVNQKQNNRAREILQSLGIEIGVKQERSIDLATAVSGSGPAYVFLFQEMLQGAGQSLGLSKKLARQLTEETIWGALNLQRQLNIESKVLRKQVTSKGGTTAAALQVFGRHNIKSIFIKAIQAAYLRIQELKQL